MKKLAYSRGYTLLELTLAVSLASVFLMSFFIGFSTFIRGINMASMATRGPDEAAVAVDLMTADIDQASAVISVSPYAIDLLTPGGRIAYAATGTPQDTMLVRYSGGSLLGITPLGGTGASSYSIGPRRVIANLNPYRSILLDSSGIPHPVASPVAVFDNPVTPPVIRINLALQPLQEATISYVRGAGNPRTIW